MRNTPPSIAATSTLAMVRTAEAHGIETADLLEEAGLTPAYLEDPDARIAGDVVLALWDALRDRAADPLLQLAAPTSLPFGAYRVIDYLVAASATVGEGVLRFVRFFGLIADAVTLKIDPGEEGQILGMTMAGGGAVPPVYVDYVFAALVGRTRMRIRPELEVRLVELRQPPPSNPAPYTELFRAPVHFGAAFDRLYFSGEEWSAPTRSADAALAQLLEDHARILAERRHPAAAAIRSEVQNAIAAALPEGGSAADVARALHLSVRTLQRKLVAGGTSFREVADEVRCQLAEEYLADPKVSVAEVAFLLGFSDQTSFNRAFRRWTGESPGRWRNRRQRLRVRHPASRREASRGHVPLQEPTAILKE
jgi:AraC-like DNA-binding protein